MAVRKIIRMGHPTLRQRARELTTAELKTPELARLIVNMVDTLHDYGGIGLAAPQVNEPVRLAITEIGGGPSRYGEIPQMPLTVFVNPTIEVVNEQAAGYWEGCLSVPGLRGFVERPQHVRVTYQDLKGAMQTLELKGFLATVFQHEFDHLDGKLYVDRIKDPSKLAYDEEYLKWHMQEEEPELL
jgi:peptide deformylase